MRESEKSTKPYQKHIKIRWRDAKISFNPLTPMSDEWSRENYPLQYQYNINQISDENKEKYQFGDNESIQY